MISDSAREVSSRIRLAAASVSRITCGRGRGFGLATGAGELVVLVMASSRRAMRSALAIQSSCPLMSPHVEDEAGFIAHPVRRPLRLPHDADIDNANAWDAGDCVLHHGRQLAGGRTVRRGQGHEDVDAAVVLDVDLVDQAEL